MNWRIILEVFGAVVIGVLAVGLFATWTERCDLERHFSQWKNAESSEVTILRGLLEKAQRPTVRVTMQDEYNNTVLDNTHTIRAKDSIKHIFGAYPSQMERPMSYTLYIRDAD